VWLCVYNRLRKENKKKHKVHHGEDADREKQGDRGENTDGMEGRG